MCTIAIKRAGVEMPTPETISNLWTNNPDGAGVMWAQDGVVHIEKGFMKLHSLNGFLANLGSRINLTDTCIVMHFRITTHGGTSAVNTHPFPICNTVEGLQTLSCVTDIGVAHNGIIPINTCRSDVSDTMQYIMSRLTCIKQSDGEFYKDSAIMDEISRDTKSRLAFLTGDGNVYTVGTWVNDSGVQYSNENFRKHEPTRAYNYSPYSYFARCAHPRRIALMCLCDNVTSVSVIGSDGEPMDDETVLVDKSGHYFVLDDLTGCAFRESGLHVYGSVRWEYESSQAVITYDSAEEMYDDYFGREPW